MIPSIDPKVAALAPDFRAISLVVEAGRLRDGAHADAALDEACRLVAQNEPDWAAAHLDAWAEMFRRFGAKPQRTPCSAEALRKRVLRDGALPRVNPIVDLYNAISLRFAVPVGGENLDAYVGSPRLIVATGAEIFDTMKDGVLTEEAPEPGEVVWTDDRGVTCRRWNWRQGVRTRLSDDATRMWFILESLAPMPIDALHVAAAELERGLCTMMPDARIEQSFLAAGG